MNAHISAASATLRIFGSVMYAGARRAARRIRRTSSRQWGWWKS
jgi:hypothetical protein